MRGTPRTTVPLTVPVLRAQWVVFEVTGNEEPLNSSERATCDQFWSELGLSGAVTVVDLFSEIGKKVAEDVSPTVCSDWRLTANVAHRIRDGLLHTRFPLLQRLEGTPHRWATDDPRLVHLVHPNRKDSPL